MMKKKKRILLSFGTLLTFVGLVVSVAGFAGYTVDSESINASDPMFSFIFAGLLLLICGIVVLGNSLVPKKEVTAATTSVQVTRLAQAALFAALSYIGFQVFRFDIPIGTEKTAFHFGNTFVVLAALLLGGSWGGMAGAVGLTIADLTSGYATSAPKTFFLKLCIGLITGFVAHHIFHLTKEGSPHATSDAETDAANTNRSGTRKLTVATITSSLCGMAFNLVADPLVGYFYKKYLFGIPQDIAVTLAKISALTTFVNAITSVLFASILYLALRPVLIKAGLFVRME